MYAKYENETVEVKATAGYTALRDAILNDLGGAKVEGATKGKVTALHLRVCRLFARPLCGLIANLAHNRGYPACFVALEGEGGRPHRHAPHLSELPGPPGVF